MDQAGQTLIVRKLLQMRAGFAQSQAARLHPAKPELFAHQMIQRHAASHDVAPSVTQSVIDSEFSLNGFDGFDFDQGKLAVGLWLRKGSLVIVISIAFESSAGDRARFADYLNRRCRVGRDV